MLNERQQYYITRLLQDIDATDPADANIYARNIYVGNAAGSGTYGAEQFSATVLKGKVTVQATISAMKEITGNKVILLLIVSGIVFILPYHRNETT